MNADIQDAFGEWRGRRLAGQIFVGLLLCAAVEFLSVVFYFAATAVWMNGVFGYPEWRWTAFHILTQGHIVASLAFPGFFLASLLARWRQIAPRRLEKAALDRQTALREVLSPALIASFSGLIAFAAISLIQYAQFVSLLEAVGRYLSLNRISAMEPGLSPFGAPLWHSILVGLSLLWISVPMFKRGAFPGKLHNAIAICALVSLSAGLGLEESVLQGMIAVGPDTPVFFLETSPIWFYVIAAGVVAIGIAISLRSERAGKAYA